MNGHESDRKGPATFKLAQYGVNLRYEDLPGEVIEHAKLCILDALGCGIFGATFPWSQKIQELVQAFGARPQATVWGTQLLSSASDAAFCNGTACHGFEMDDIYDKYYLHPGAVAVPAALAVAEMQGGVSGKEFLESVVAAYEISGRIGRALGQAVVLRGFHSHGIHGCMAAGVASAKVLSLSEMEMVHTLGIAGSQGAGLMAAQEGAMVKRMHSGRAAQSGVISALLAAKGFTGIEDVLEAKFGGYAIAFGGLEDVNEKTFCSDLGERYLIHDVGFKLYPAAAGTHCAIQAIEEILKERAIDVGDISKIEVYTSTFTLKHCGWPYVGGGGVIEAQMNIAYAVATVLKHGTVTIDAFSPEALSDQETMKLTRLVEVFSDPEIDGADREMRHASRICLYLRDGSVISKFEPYRRGSQKNPVDRSELLRKFLRLAGDVLGDERGRQLEGLILNIEDVKEIREIGSLLHA